LTIHEYRIRKFINWLFWITGPICIMGIIYLNYKFMMLHGLGNYEEYGISYNNIVEKKEYSRLLYSMFAHANLKHFVGNMVSLLIFGLPVANRENALKTSIIYLGSGFTGSITSLAFYHYIGNDMVCSIGASGAIMGMYGACMAMNFAYGTGNKTKIIVRTLLVCVYMSLGANINIACHLGGCIGGFIIMLLFSIKDKYKWAEQDVIAASTNVLHTPDLMYEAGSHGKYIYVPGRSEKRIEKRRREAAEREQASLNSLHSAGNDIP